MKHLAGLDTLRGAAAVWVMLYHVAPLPLTQGHDPSSMLSWAFNGVWSGFISGPAAVILFFVISGLCVHYAFAQGRQFHAPEFLVRRYARIAVPLLGAVLLCRLSAMFETWRDPVLAPQHAVIWFQGKKWFDPFAGIPAWSLVAELIYYSLYPSLRRLAAHIGWTRLTIVSFLFALVWALATKGVTQFNYPAWGYAADWIVGLPCWLTGVVLAESLRHPLPKPSPLLWWRIGAVCLGALTHHLALQHFIGQHLTLNGLAIYAFFWVRREVAFFSVNMAPKRLEWLGTWSYSLYLVHYLAHHYWVHLAPPRFGLVMDWLLKVFYVLGFSYLFFLVCEKPSHRLARWLGKRIGASSTLELVVDVNG